MRGTPGRGMAVAYSANLGRVTGGDFQEQGRLGCSAMAHGVTLSLAWHPVDMATVPKCGERAWLPPIAVWLRIPYLVEMGIASGDIVWAEVGGQWALREAGY